MRNRRARQKKEVRGANWMDTYGDFVTLLLTFFVMLFASSTMSEAKWQSIVESFAQNPNNAVIETIDPINPTAWMTQDDMITRVRADMTGYQPAKTETAQNAAGNQDNMLFEELYQKLKAYIDANGLASVITLTRDGNNIYLTVVEGILFQSGQANVKDAAAEKILSDVGGMIAHAQEGVLFVTVEGHTDNVPIRTAQFQDNLDLSAMRAANVARFINEKSKVDMSKFVTIGRGEWAPVADNETPQGREKNRRVRFIIEGAGSIK